MATSTADKKALATACWYVETEKVRALLERGVNANGIKGDPLYKTVSTPNDDADEVLRLLLDHGVNINVRYESERSGSALGIALETGHPKLAEMLLDAGADLTIKDRDGQTPVKIAKAEGYTKLVQRMTGKPGSKTKKAALDPFVEATYVGQIAKGKAPHTSGIPDWKKVFKGKHLSGCNNPPVHLLTIDLALVPEFPEVIRGLGKMPIVSHACECDEQDVYRFTIAKDGRLAPRDADKGTDCKPRDYHPSKKATPIQLVPEAPGVRGSGIFVGGQPRWAQTPFWPSCPKCEAKSFFVATLYQFYLPPSARGRGNTLNVFACGACRTQSMVRQST